MDLRKLIVYGAGNTGRAFVEAGARPQVFLDRRARGEVGGVRIVAPDELHLCCRHDPVVTAVFRPEPECATARVFADLEALGYGDLTDFESFYQSKTVDFKRAFMWLAPIDFFKLHAPELDAAARLFAHDPASAELFALQREHRLGADWRTLPPPSPAAHQYFDPTVPLNLPANWNFADLGGYTGDTLLALPKGVAFASVFEPDAENFRQLRTNAVTLPFKTALFNAGAGAEDGEAAFTSGHGEASAFGGGGKARVMKPDALFGHTCPFPDYVKLDVEGMEMSALAGLQNTIRRRRPAVAAALYHRPEDIYAIPLYLNELNPNYRFYIRCYGHHAMETFLYAVNEGGR